LLRNEKRIESLLRKGKNYLMHHILDKEVDKYLKLKSELSEELKQVEKEFMTVQSKEVLTKMYSQELDFLELRHLSESITDLCSNLMKHSENKEENSLIPYFKDVYDHALKTTEGYESMLKRMDGMEELYATITTMKTNEVMRSLTIITAIMMPLTVITGFYGMNVHLPFQESPLASSAILGGMFGLVLLMIIISKKAGWISKKGKE
jgi:magnesium transporter